MSGISPHKLKNPDVVATELIKLFKDKNPKAFSSVFDVNMDVDPYDILEEVGEKKKLLIKGGEVDERRAAIMVLEFWHKGKLRL
jgi:ribosome biogenesis GTPase A